MEPLLPWDMVGALCGSVWGKPTHRVAEGATEKGPDVWKGENCLGGESGFVASGKVLLPSL